MKVGDYVRFKDKRENTYIRKIVEIPEDNRYASIYIDKEANYSNGLSPKNIIKSSPNIIDLIEEGDILKLLDFQYDKEYKAEVILDYNDNLCVINFENNKIIDLKESLFEKDIKLLSIITHEQFEAMKYEVR